MNTNWTARMFSLARPFSAADVEAAFAALETLVGRKLPTLKYSRAGEKRATRFASWEELRCLPWKEKLTVAGFDEEVEISAYLYKLKPRGRMRSASAASYQCHEVIIDFPIGRIGAKEVSTVAKELTAASVLFKSEFSILCPLESGRLRQLYRERGLQEGVPDIFEITVMGPTFSSAIDVDALRSRLCFPSAATSEEGFLTLVADSRRLSVLSLNQRAEIKSLIGDSLFAGKREVPMDGSGVFSVFEVFRFLRGVRKADQEAMMRSSDIDFKFDWAGVFDCEGK